MSAIRIKFPQSSFSSCSNRPAQLTAVRFARFKGLRPPVPCARKGAWRGSWLHSSWMAHRDTMSFSREKKLKEGAIAADTNVYDYLRSNAIHQAATTGERRAVYWRMKDGVRTTSFCGQVRPRMDLITTAISTDQIPLPRLPEVAFVGRSNVGKSTIVNYLTGHLTKAICSSTPGSTKELHFYKVGKPPTLSLVDLPGFGFAEATEAQRLQWCEFSLQYLRTRKNLKRVFVLIDGRRFLRPADRELLSYLDRHRVKWQVIVTKCDLVRLKELSRRITMLKEELAEFKYQSGVVFPVSAKRFCGLEPIRRCIEKFKLDKEVVKDGIRVRVTDGIELRRLQKADRRMRKKQAEEEKKAAQELPSEGENDSKVSSALGRWGLPKTNKDENKVGDHFSVEDVFSTREGRRVLDIAINLYSLEHLSAQPEEVASSALNEEKPLFSGGGLLTGLFDKVNATESEVVDDFDGTSPDGNNMVGSSPVEFDFAGRNEFFSQADSNNTVTEFDFRDPEEILSNARTDQNNIKQTQEFKLKQTENDDDRQSFLLEQTPVKNMHQEISFDMRDIPDEIHSNNSSIFGDMSEVPVLKESSKSILKQKADAITLRLANTKEAIEAREKNMNLYHRDELVSETEIASGFRQRSRKPDERSDLEDMSLSVKEGWRVQLVEDDPFHVTSGLKTSISNVGDGFGTDLNSGIVREGEFPRAQGKMVNVRRRRYLNKTRRIISTGNFDKTATGFIQMRNAKSFKDLEGAGGKSWLIKGKPLNKKGTPKKAISIVDRIKLKEDINLKSFEEMKKKWKAWASNRKRNIVMTSLPPIKEQVDGQTPWFDRETYKTPEEKRKAQGLLPLDRSGPKAIKSHRGAHEKKKRGKKKGPAARMTS